MKHRFKVYPIERPAPRGRPTWCGGLVGRRVADREPGLARCLPPSPDMPQRGV